ncbi:MAG: serine/threonine protein kinase [Amphiamblys sp. WSBS2006]|nr:MAG: serine/threonine protein kinase [Amphiamblys sp. WSBS2006]
MLSLRAPLYFPILVEKGAGGVQRTERAGFLVLSRDVLSVSGASGVKDEAVFKGVSTEKKRVFEEIKKRHAEQMKYAVTPDNVIYADGVVLPILPWSRVQKRGMIGEGGNSDIFLVRDRGSGAEYAVKIPKKANHRGYVQEGYLQRKSQFKNIVRVAGFLRDGERLLLACEYQRYITLKKKIRRNLLSEKKCVYVAAQLVAIVRRLHSLGVHHLDIAPDNIFIGSDGHVVLGDFGDARSVSPEGGCADKEAVRRVYRAADWIGVGRCVYCFLYGEKKFKTYVVDEAQRVLSGPASSSEISFPRNTGISADARQFITDLTTPAVSGMLQGDQIRQRKWFKNINWERYGDVTKRS